MPIDEAKVQAKVQELNVSTPDHPNWFAAPGFHALTVLDFTTPQPTFIPTNGIPLKSFLNSVTGEIRIYDARKFKVD